MPRALRGNGPESAGCEAWLCRCHAEPLRAGPMQAMRQPAPVRRLVWPRAEAAPLAWRRSCSSATARRPRSSGAGGAIGGETRPSDRSCAPSAARRWACRGRGYCCVQLRPRCGRHVGSAAPLLAAPAPIGCEVRASGGLLSRAAWQRPRACWSTQLGFADATQNRCALDPTGGRPTCARPPLSRAARRGRAACLATILFIGHSAQAAQRWRRGRDWRGNPPARSKLRAFRRPALGLPLRSP